MTFTLTVSILIAKAQPHEPEKDDVYKVGITLTNNFHDFQTAGSTCGSSPFSAQPNTLLKVISIIDANTIAVQIIRAYIAQPGTTNEVTKNLNYCISKHDLSTFTIFQDQTETGFLTVPFKIRISPINVFLGGNIGYFIGHRYDKGKTSSTILGFAGASTVSLNDANADVPETKIGATAGLGFVWKLKNNFQIGVVSGIDLFDGVEKWKYKFQPWIAFGIGFKFTSPNAPSSSQTLQ